MPKIGSITYFIIIFFPFCSCSIKEPGPAVQIKKLNYPSASAAEYLDNKLYIIGDDATNILVLDSNLDVSDSIPLLDYSARRIPKDIKPDLESSALYSKKGHFTILFLFGSGSLSPHRNTVWLRLFEAKINRDLSFEDFYTQLKIGGIEQINVEGACFIPGKLLLVNRGNKSYQNNHLVITDEKFWENDSTYKMTIIPFERQTDTATFKGISGLAYTKQSDQLIMTVSTEDTRNAYEDGAIGKSYLWIINNVSDKLNLQTLKPDKIIDLESIDRRFKGEKIESATVIEETRNSMSLVLVADNDDGTSTIFKMNISKN